MNAQHQPVAGLLCDGGDITFGRPRPHRADHAEQMRTATPTTTAGHARGCGSVDSSTPTPNPATAAPIVESDARGGPGADGGGSMASVMRGTLTTQTSATAHTATGVSSAHRKSDPIEKFTTLIGTAVVPAVTPAGRIANDRVTVRRP